MSFAQYFKIFAITVLTSLLGLSCGSNPPQDEESGSVANPELGPDTVENVEDQEWMADGYGTENSTLYRLDEETAVAEEDKYSRKEPPSKDYINNLHPDSPEAEEVEREITEAIRNDLRDAEWLTGGGNHIQVETIDLVVHLKGSVVDEEQKEKVIALAEKYVDRENIKSNLGIIHDPRILIDPPGDEPR